MLLDQSNNQSGGDSFKRYLAEQGKKEALRRSQDYLNENFSETGDDFDFADQADIDVKPFKEIAIDAAKKQAKKEALKRSQDFLNDRFGGGGANFDFAEGGLNKPFADIAKDEAKKHARREVLKRSQDFLNDKFGGNGANFDFADNPGNEAVKDIFKNTAKKFAADEAKKQGRKLFDYAKEYNPRFGDLEKLYDPENDDPEKRFAGIKGTNKDEVKNLAQDLIDKEGKDALKKRIKRELEQYLEKAGKRTATQEVEHLANKGFKYGVNSGIKKGVKSVAKEGIESVAKSGVKTATKEAVKIGTKVGAEAAADVALEGGVELLGAAGAAETFGISEVLAQLIVIAISLGVSDAIDGTECLLKKEYKKAMHFFIRAATKIILFVVFLVLFIVCTALIPVFGFFIPLALINLYWSIGIIPFVNDLAIAQGLVWWEKIIIVVMDVASILFLGITAIVMLYVWCNIGSTIGFGVGGTIGSTIGGVIDRATTEKGSYCTAFQNLSGGSGGGSINGSGDSSPGTELGDETVGTFTPPGGSCKFSGVNLCKGIVGGNCSNTAIYNRVKNDWGAKIQEQLTRYGNIPGVANSHAFIEAIMTQESGGDPNAESPTGAAGLMQFTTGAANTYGPQCSSSYNSSRQWRKDNPMEQICMSIKYFQSIAAGQCGKPRVEVRNLAAGYNRGPGYCRPADGTYTSCTGNGCDGTPIKSWECLWTDAAHNSCNKYVEEGQKYAQFVFGCYTKFNSGN